MTECKHLLALRAFLVDNGLKVWSEHGEEPAGWVNVSCGHCSRTYEITLKDDNEDDNEELELEG